MHSLWELYKSDYLYGDNALNRKIRVGDKEFYIVRYDIECRNPNIWGTPETRYTFECIETNNSGLRLKMNSDELYNRKDVTMINEKYINNLVRNELSFSEAKGRSMLQIISMYVYEKHTDGCLIDEIDDAIPIVEKELRNYKITNAVLDDEGYLYITTGNYKYFIGDEMDNINKLKKFIEKKAIKNDILFKDIRVKEDKFPIINDILYYKKQHYRIKHEE